MSLIRQDAEPPVEVVTMAMVKEKEMLDVQRRHAEPWANSKVRVFGSTPDYSSNMYGGYNTNNTGRQLRVLRIIRINY